LDSIAEFKPGRPAVWVNLGSTWGRPGVDLGSDWGQTGVSLGSAWGQIEVKLGSTWGLPGVSLGSTWGQPGVSLGSASGQPGVNLGSTRGQRWVNLGLTLGQPAPPYLEEQPGGSLALAALQQGLILVHFSVQREHFSWNTVGGSRLSLTKTAQVQLGPDKGR
jgi:hypothetical protein